MMKPRFDSVIMGYISPGSRKPKLVVDYTFIFPIDKVPGACVHTPRGALHCVCVFHGLVCVCDDSVKLDPLLRKEYLLLKQYRL